MVYVVYNNHIILMTADIQYDWGSVIAFSCTDGQYLYNSDILRCAGDAIPGTWISSTSQSGSILRV